MPQALQLLGYVHAIADSFSCWHEKISGISKIVLVVYYQCCVLIGWATTRLYVIAHQ